MSTTWGRVENVDVLSCRDWRIAFTSKLNRRDMEPHANSELTVEDAHKTRSHAHILSEGGSLMSL